MCSSMISSTMSFSKVAYGWFFLAPDLAYQVTVTGTGGYIWIQESMRIVGSQKMWSIYWADLWRTLVMPDFGNKVGAKWTMGADPILRSPIENDSSNLGRSRVRGGPLAAHSVSFQSLRCPYPEPRNIWRAGALIGIGVGTIQIPLCYEILAIQKSQRLKERKKTHRRVTRL